MILIAFQNASNTLSYELLGILLLLLIAGLIVGGIILGHSLLWIAGILIIFLIIIWTIMLVLEATKAFGKSFGSSIKKFIIPHKNNNKKKLHFSAAS